MKGLRLGKNEAHPPMAVDSQGRERRISKDSVLIVFETMSVTQTRLDIFTAYRVTSHITTVHETVSQIKEKDGGVINDLLLRSFWSRRHQAHLNLQGNKSSIR